MNKNHISFLNSVIATTAHTATIYGAPLIGLKQVDIGGMISKKIFRTENHAPGLIIHYLLGTVIFPWSYNLVAKNFLPKNKTTSSLTWGLMLWSFGHTVVVPVLADRDYFKKKPSRAAAYFLAHVAYGICCSGKNKRS
ncbi:MAG: hypothetical protein SGJ27_13655 [Candidatus Melainabacteria bacterium]|nr:hypothetical protein [Candidatus Melainabacteria bacterium]